MYQNSLASKIHFWLSEIYGSTTCGYIDCGERWCMYLTYKDSVLYWGELQRNSNLNRVGNFSTIILAQRGIEMGDSNSSFPQGEPIKNTSFSEASPMLTETLKGVKRCFPYIKAPEHEHFLDGRDYSFFQSIEKAVWFDGNCISC